MQTCRQGQGHHSQRALPGVIQLQAGSLNVQAEPTGSENDGGEVGRAARCDWSHHVRLRGMVPRPLARVWGSVGGLFFFFKERAFRDLRREQELSKNLQSLRDLAREEPGCPYSGIESTGDG